MQQSNGARGITLKPDFWKLAEDRGWGSDAEIAGRIGTNRVTVWRLRTGRTNPGEQVIAAVLAALPDAQFGDLFEVA